MKILVTGGLGYIGSHVCVELLQNGHETAIVDNLCNAERQALGRIRAITGRNAAFYEDDIRDRRRMEAVLRAERPDAVIHCAGLKAVGESVEEPLTYYDNNVCGTVSLLQAMQACGVRDILFSSSATVYAQTEAPPLTEDAKTEPYNPYGRTKRVIESILEDVKTAQDGWTVIILRYFNPVGAHESGLIGEDPVGVPNNIMPRILGAAAGDMKELKVFGDDYPTPDGTGVRDYIHVMDLAEGHRVALERLHGSGACKVYNLGTGKGLSVMQIIGAFEAATGVRVPYGIAPRRRGDIAEYYADSTKARQELGWAARRDVAKMCADAWNWLKKSKNGV